VDDIGKTTGDSGQPGRKLGLEIVKTEPESTPAPQQEPEQNAPAGDVSEGGNVEKKVTEPEPREPEQAEEAPREKKAPAPQVADPWDRMAERMAEKIAEQKKGDLSSEPAGYSGGTVVAIISLAALVVVSVYFYMYQKDVTARLDSMKAQLTILSMSGAPEPPKPVEKKSTIELTMMNAELGRSIIALEKVQAFGDPKLTEEAGRLRDDIAQVMAELEELKAVAAAESANPESEEYVSSGSQ